MTDLDDGFWKPLQDPDEVLNGLADNIIRDIIIVNRYPIEPAIGQSLFTKSLRSMRMPHCVHDGYVGLVSKRPRHIISWAEKQSLGNCVPDESDYTLNAWYNSFAILLAKHVHTANKFDEERIPNYIADKSTIFVSHFHKHLLAQIPLAREQLLWSCNGQRQSTARDRAFSEINKGVYMQSMEFGVNTMGTMNPVDLFNFTWYDVDQERMPHRTAIEQFFQGRYLSFLAAEKGYYIRTGLTGNPDYTYIQALTHALPQWSQMPSTTFEKKVTAETAPSKLFRPRDGSRYTF